VVNVFTIDAYALSRGGEKSVADCEQAQRSLGLAQNMPFLLREDGQPVRDANQWLRALPTRGCASPLSWKAYAGDFADWLRFLDTRNTTPLAATREDLAAYHSDLRLGGGVSLALGGYQTSAAFVGAVDGHGSWEQVGFDAGGEILNYGGLRLIDSGGRLADDGAQLYATGGIANSIVGAAKVGGGTIEMTTGEGITILGTGLSYTTASASGISMAFAASVSTIPNGGC
jgi:hypothetical protein